MTRTADKDKEGLQRMNAYLNRWAFGEPKKPRHQHQWKPYLCPEYAEYRCTRCGGTRPMSKEMESKYRAREK